MTYPKDLNGKPTTKEQWDQYEADLKIHEMRIEIMRIFLERVLLRVSLYGIDEAREYFTKDLDKDLSMDAPNKPGYFRANND